VNTVNQIFLLRILSKKIQRLLIMKELETNYNNLDSLISASKPPIFWKEKPMVKKQLTIWSLNDLKTTIYEVNDTEVLCKKNPQISKIITFTGHDKDNPLSKLGDINFWINSKAYNFVENTHQVWLLTIVDLIIGKREYSPN